MSSQLSKGIMGYLATFSDTSSSARCSEHIGYQNLYIPGNENNGDLTANAKILMRFSDEIVPSFIVLNVKCLF